MGLFWLLISGPLATGPISYGIHRGWFPRQPGDSTLSWVNRYLSLVGLQHHAESYQQWWSMQARFANFNRRLEEDRQRAMWHPPSAQVMQHLRRGGFTRVTLREDTYDWQVVEGYAASDPQNSEFIRIDGLVLKSDGGVDRFALRVPPNHIETAEPLDAAPRLQLPDGSTVNMPAEFWPAPGK